jgi:phosphoribosylanthranilate isomerase
VKIKICGLFREEDITYVNKYKPDYIGFVFAKSQRQVTKNQAYILKQLLDSKIKAVGVFVNAPIALIREIVQDHIIDLIQLHGQEDEEYIKALKEVVDVPIIKAIRVGKDEMKSYDVDYYLLDGMKPGSGQSFNWSQIQELDHPIFLAGGISMNNIHNALKTNVYALDLSSGVEKQGVKNEALIKEVIRSVRNG